MFNHSWPSKARYATPSAAPQRAALSISANTTISQEQETMRQVPDTLRPIVTDDLRAAANEVIRHVRRNTPYQFLLDAKLGDANTGPISDIEIASAHGTPPSTTSYRWTHIVDAVAQSEQQHGRPLGQVSQRANAVMANGAIINRHKRRPPLYSESTISAFIKLGFATPEHSPLIRAAGYVSSPPATPQSHDIDDIIADIAAHMARSHDPQSPDEILSSLHHRQADLSNWPRLDLTLLIDRVSGIKPDQQGLFHSHQPWCRFISSSQLVTNTMLRILARDQRPRTTVYLIEEIERLVGHFLPPGYKTLSAVRAAISKSDDITWQGLATFGLRDWETALGPQSMASRRGRTGDLIYAFLMQHGPAYIEDVFQHVQRSSKAKRRTVQEAINHDPAERFVRMPDGRMAAYPIRLSRDADTAALTVVPDGQRHRPGPVLHESELMWLTRYVQALNDLAPPLTEQVAVTGPRAAGFAQGDPLEITVVVDPSHRPSLEPRLASIAAATSELVPSVRPHISLLSPQQWDHQQEGEAPEAHHNA